MYKSRFKLGDSHETKFSKYYKVRFGNLRKKLLKRLLGARRFASYPPLVVGSETFGKTFRFFHPNNNTYIVGVEARRFASFPHWLLEANVSLPNYLLVVGSETFRFFYPNNNTVTYIVGVEARRFASFPHWLLEARRFASFLYWLFEAKRFASFTQTTIHILWAWKRDVSLPLAISNGS